MKRLTLSAVAAACACTTAPPPRPPPLTALDTEPPRIVSAFFGLDDALPLIAARICRKAVGADGMPVTFSRRVVTDGSDVPIDAFTVLTRSGEKKTPVCATLEPATEASEGHTVLLIGEFGDESDDPPARVQITGSLPLEGGVDGQGLEWDVTPLKEGPTIVMAVAFPTEAIETDCPTTTKQVVMAVWAGGVTPAKGETDESHRMMYTVESAAGSSTPFALGNLGDRDNYVHLCLEASTPAVRVRARAGVLVDPRGDLNPDTAVSVVR